MPWLTGIVVAFALLTIIGGISGYVNAGSVPSLIAGVGAGLLLLGGAAWAKSNIKWGYAVCAVVCLLIIGRFLPAYLKDTDKIWPALIMAVGAGVTLIALIIGHFVYNARPSA